MFYVYPTNSEIGACAVYLGYFQKFADDAHKLIYMTIQQIDGVIAWAKQMGIA